MKLFWKELKNHSGVTFGFLFPALGFFAGATNRTIASTTEAFLFGLICMGVMGVLIWTPILCTTYSRVKQIKKDKETNNPLLQFLDN